MKGRASRAPRALDEEIMGESLERGTWMEKPVAISEQRYMCPAFLAATWEDWGTITMVADVVV